jgi:hypothetical protein
MQLFCLDDEPTVVDVGLLILSALADGYYVKDTIFLLGKEVFNL